MNLAEGAEWACVEGSKSDDPERDPFAQKRTRGARRRKAVLHATESWSSMTQDQRREVLNLFEDAYDNYTKDAFGSELQAAAALNWVVIAFQNANEWRPHEDVLHRLRDRLTRVFERTEPYKTAISKMSDSSPSTVHPQLVRDWIRDNDFAAYNAEQNRQNKALTNFQKWATKKSPTLLPYVAAFVALLVSLALPAKASAATLAAEAARRASRTLWTRLLLLIAVCAIVAVVWYLLRDGDSGSSTQTADVRGSGMVTHGGNGSAAGTSFEGGVGLGATGRPESPADSQTAGGTRPAGLRHEPFFQLMSLSQNVAFVTHPGHLPDITRQGWQDYSDLDSVPDEYRAQWERVRELDGLAATQSREGRYEDALKTYQQLVEEKNRPGGWRRVSGGLDVDKYIESALSRRLGRFPDKGMHLGFDGPAVLGMTQYEAGRVLEQRGAEASALAAYASCIWRSVVVSDSVLATRMANLAASNWSHLTDLPSMYADARERAKVLAAARSSAKTAMIADGLVVWSTGSALVAVSIDPAFAPACTIGDPGSDKPDYHFGQTWKVSTELDGVVQVQENLAFENSSIAMRSIDAPKVPTRHTLVVRRTLVGASRAQLACSNIAEKISFCLMPDRRLLDSQSCP